MKLCLVVSGDNERLSKMSYLIESLGFIVLVAADKICAGLSAQGLLPDVIVLDSGIADQGFIESLATLKNGKKPSILQVENSDDDLLTSNFFQQKLRGECVYQPIGF